MPSSPQPAVRRVSLQTKVVGFLLVISMIPLAVSAVLINQAAEVAHNFATNEAALLRPPLESARSAYLALITTRRDLYYPQVALRLSALPEVAALARGEGDPAALTRLDGQLAATHELVRVAVVGAGDELWAMRETRAPHGVTEPTWREVSVRAPIADTDATLVLTFAASDAYQAEVAALGRALRVAERIDEVRSALPSSYRRAFLVLVGAVVLLVSVTGIILARRFIRRISALVSGTRQVTGGDLTARVALRGRDELAELARAFNRMVEQLEHDRAQIAYLQRVGAWQDVARRLAHEIKNPLTPIQLAVQQCVSSYRGDDERYRRLLRDTEEIVTEEIAGLRRLVDAFRTLGQLPRVDARPLALALVVDDLGKDPTLLEQLVSEPPDEPVMIRGDRLLLRRVLANLVENGIQAGREAGRAGRVRVRWRPDGDAGCVRITVEDEGGGVPAAQRERIFEPYITSKEHGTGLGLTIAKKIALEHGGALELAAERGELGGARFVLTLPLAGDAVADAEPAASEPPGAGDAARASD